MSDKYDGWIIREKDGSWWLGTLSPMKTEVKERFGNIAKHIKKHYGLKVVKVRLVEVE